MAVKVQQTRMVTIRDCVLWTAAITVIFTCFVKPAVGQSPERRYACWGSFGPPVVSAQCPRNTVIQVIRAGLKVQNNGGLCAYNENDCGCEYGQTGCQMQDVRQLCMGRPACRMDVTQQYISTPTCKGFSDYMYIEFNCVQVEHNSVSEICSSVRTTSEHGFLRSPNYPSMTRARRECDCTLTTDDGSSIELTVLDIQTSDYKCETDKLQVAYDGRTDIYCGQQADSAKKRIASKSSVVSVKFNTDGQGEGGSFWLKYQADPKADVKLMCTYTETETPQTPALTTLLRTTAKETTIEDPLTTEVERPSPKFYKPMERKKEVLKKKKEKVKPKGKKPWWWKYLQNPNSTKPFYRQDKKVTKAMLMDSVKSMKGRPQYQRPMTQTKLPTTTTTKSDVTAVNHNGYNPQLNQQHSKFVQENKGKFPIKGPRPPNNRHLQQKQKLSSNSFVDKTGRRWSHLPESLLNKLQFPVPLIQALEKELTPDKNGNKPSSILIPSSSSHSSSYKPSSKGPKSPNLPKSNLAYPPGRKKFSRHQYYRNRQRQSLKSKETLNSMEANSKFPERTSNFRGAPQSYKPRPYYTGKVQKGKMPPQSPHRNSAGHLPSARTTADTAHYLPKITTFDKKTEGVKQRPVLNMDRTRKSGGSNAKTTTSPKPTTTLRLRTTVPVTTMRPATMKTTLGIAVTQDTQVLKSSKGTGSKAPIDKAPKLTPSYIKVSESSDLKSKPERKKNEEVKKNDGEVDSGQIKYKKPMSKEASQPDWEEPLDYPFDKSERKPYPKIRESFKPRSYRRRRKYKKKIRKYDHDDEDDDYDERDDRKKKRVAKVKKRKYKIRRVWKERPDKTRVSVVRPEAKMYVNINNKNNNREEDYYEEETETDNSYLDTIDTDDVIDTITTTQAPDTPVPQSSSTVASTKSSMLKDSVHSDDVVVEELAGKIETVSDFYTALDEEDWTQWPAFEMVKTAQEGQNKVRKASTTVMTTSEPTTKPPPTPPTHKPVPKQWMKPRKHYNSNSKRHKKRVSSKPKPKPKPKHERVRPTPPHTVRTAQPDLLANSLSLGNSIQQGPKTRLKVSSASHKPKPRTPRRKPVHSAPPDHVPSKSESLTNPKDNTVTIIAACVVGSILIVIVLGIVIRFVVNRKKDRDHGPTTKAKRYVRPPSPETTYPGQRIPRPKRI